MTDGATTHRVTGLYQWKEAKADLAQRAPEAIRKSASTCHSAAHKAHRAWPSAEQTDLGEGWNHVRGSVLSRPRPLHHHNLNPLSWSRRRTRSLKRPPPERRLGLRCPSQNLQQPLSQPLGRQRRKQPQVSNPRPPIPQPFTWWSPPNLKPRHSRKSLISSITSLCKHVCN